MKDDNASTMQGKSISFTYGSSSTNLKYGGIIKRSFMKQIRKDLSLLFSFIFSVAPHFSVVHTVVSVFRLLQFCGPALVSGYSSFWSPQNHIKDTVGIISIFYHLIPPVYRSEYGFYFVLIYIIILFLIILILFGCSYYYKKTANLPLIFPTIVSFYLASFGCVLHPICIELVIAEIGRLAFEPNAQGSLVKVIVPVVIALILTIVFFAIYFGIASRTLLFKPASLQSATASTQNMMYASQIIVTGLIALPEYSTSKILQAVFVLISAIVYGCSITIQFRHGGIINKFQGAAFIASCGSSCIMCIIVAISLFLNKPGTMAHLIIFLGVFVCLFILSLFILNRIHINHLNTLDLLQEEPSLFDEKVKSVSHFYNLAINGFKVAHPFCLSWNHFKMGVEKWPMDSLVWLIYAKFIAIFPEETQTLWWIYRDIVQRKIHGTAARTVKEQSMTIARQREPNLSPELKNKLNTAQRHTSSSKQKLRHVWDLAIQGNVGDMENASRRAIKDIEKVDAELKHVLRQFPNNRFATRQYARFARELMADSKMYAEMVEKTRLLQRGVQVNKDQAHEFGLGTFEELPERIKCSSKNETLNSIAESITTSTTEFEPEEEIIAEADETEIIRTRIRELAIPSIFGSLAMRSVIFWVVYALPMVVLLCLMNIFVESQSDILPHMFNIASLRTYTYFMTSMCIRRVYELLNFFPAPTPSSDHPPNSLGGKWETGSMLSYVCSQVTITMQSIEKFRIYDAYNPIISKCHKNVFDKTLGYSYYTGLVPTVNKVTVQTAMADFITQQKELLHENYHPPNSIINTSVVYNPLLNLGPLATLLDDTVLLLIDYVTMKFDSNKKMITILMYTVLVLYCILFIIETIITIFWIRYNKVECYKCLTSLPKNAVSQVAENLRVLKKEDNSSSATTNSETNKQEDNILKVFVTGGTSAAAKIFDITVFCLTTIILVACGALGTFFVGTMAMNVIKTLRQNCAHINNLHGAFGMTLGTMLCVLELCVKNRPNLDIPLAYRENIIERYNVRVGKSSGYYDRARFGGSSIDEPPYSGFDQGVDDAQKQVECKNPYEPVVEFLDAVSCFPADVLMIMLGGMWNSRLVPYYYSDADKLDLDTTLEMSWSLLIFPIYDAFFEPMTVNIVEQIIGDMKQQKNNLLPVVITILIIGVLAELTAVFVILSNNTHMKSVLELLLHVPAKVVLENSRILTVLGGDFNRKRNDVAIRNAEYFHEVVMNLPDAVIVLNNEGKVISVNSSIERIFGLTSVNGSLLNQKFSDFIEGNKNFSPNIKDLLEPKTKSLQFTYTKDESEESVEATVYAIGQYTVIQMKDMTQTVRYNTLINEEKSKSDILLSSILPPSLVKRVANGEKNISFAVQSATIVFMDIVSFTPWCGSLPADKVMSTLNNLFKKFDAIGNKYPTMTKIKCIGDCYMAAGGVFSEVNQPAEHSKEVVCFGLDSLNAIRDINQELNEKLQIRVGINTGGPIVAGVLGIGKPTFEILGPAINMAQQMEHHGVPMQVHVSRSVYELIYGDTFDIKERGSIEIKNGSVITYLVARKEPK